MSLSTEVKEMLEKCGCENPEKVAIVAFCSDGITRTYFGDMELNDMALAKHEIELSIIDKFILTNADRYNTVNVAPIADTVRKMQERLKEAPIKVGLPLFGLQTKDEVEDYANGLILQMRDAIDQIAKEMLEGGNE